MKRPTFPPPGHPRPRDVLEDPALSVDAKRRLLREWLQYERDLVRADGEGMQGGPAPRLREVQEALRRLPEAP